MNAPPSYTKLKHCVNACAEGCKGLCEDPILVGAPITPSSPAPSFELLVTALEHAKSGSFDLDVAFLLATGWKLVDLKHGTQWISPDNRMCGWNSIPAYTRSIDDQRKLIPGILVTSASDIGADGLPRVVLTISTGEPVVECVGIARTLELAWAIAILFAWRHDVQNKLP